MIAVNVQYDKPNLSVEEQEALADKYIKLFCIKKHVLYVKRGEDGFTYNRNNGRVFASPLPSKKWLSTSDAIIEHPENHRQLRLEFKERDPKYYGESQFIEPNKVDHNDILVIKFWNSDDLYWISMDTIKTCSLVSKMSNKKTFESRENKVMKLFYEVPFNLFYKMEI